MAQERGYGIRKGVWWWVRKGCGGCTGGTYCRMGQEGEAREGGAKRGEGGGAEKGGGKRRAGRQWNGGVQTSLGRSHQIETRPRQPTHTGQCPVSLQSARAVGSEGNAQTKGRCERGRGARPTDERRRARWSVTSHTHAQPTNPTDPIAHCPAQTRARASRSASAVSKLGKKGQTRGRPRARRGMGQAFATIESN